MSTFEGTFLRPLDLIESAAVLKELVKAGVNLRAKDSDGKTFLQRWTLSQKRGPMPHKAEFIAIARKALKTTSKKKPAAKKSPAKKSPGKIRGVSGKIVADTATNRRRAGLPAKKPKKTPVKKAMKTTKKPTIKKLRAICRARGAVYDVKLKRCRMSRKTAITGEEARKLVAELDRELGFMNI